jgi:hypothetical protein
MQVNFNPMISQYQSNNHMIKKIIFLEKVHNIMMKFKVTKLINLNFHKIQEDQL